MPRFQPEPLKLAVGDKVMLIERVRDFEAERAAKGDRRIWTRMFRDEMTELTISKVGRKYAYVDTVGRPRQFELVGGGEVGRWQEGSARIFTNESLLRHQQRERAIHNLTKFSRTTTNGAMYRLAILELNTDNISTEGLEELRDLLEREENR